MDAGAIKTEIGKSLLEYFSPENSFVFIFGSRADGTARFNSDWDIGIICHEKISGVVMGRARDALDKIRTLQSFDLVDFATVPDGFREIAFSKIEPLIGHHEKWIA